MSEVLHLALARTYVLRRGSGTHPYVWCVTEVVLFMYLPSASLDPRYGEGNGVMWPVV